MNRRRRIHELEGTLAAAIGFVCGHAANQGRPLNDAEREWLAEVRRVMPDHAPVVDYLTEVVDDCAREGTGD